LNLDTDLRRELFASVAKEGFDWNLLPFSVQVERLMPFIQRQLAREKPLLGGCTHAAV
jgi:hypothetical protein